MTGRPGCREVFPDTVSIVERWLDEGELDEVRRHVMQAYARPLLVYFLGTRMRWLAERVDSPEEIVDGFFASRLERPDFFARWRESGKKLRHWLRISFANHYLMEVAERLRRERVHEPGEMPDLEPAADGSEGPERAMEREFGRSLVLRARDAAAEACREKGLDDHWEIFLRVKVDGIGYGEVADELGVDIVRVRRMLRTAKDLFRDKLLEQVRADFPAGCVGDAELAEEIVKLRRAIGD